MMSLLQLFLNKIIVLIMIIKENKENVCGRGVQLSKLPVGKQFIFKNLPLNYIKNNTQDQTTQWNSQGRTIHGKHLYKHCCLFIFLSLTDFCPSKSVNVYTGVQRCSAWPKLILPYSAPKRPKKKNDKVKHL